MNGSRLIHLAAATICALASIARGADAPTDWRPLLDPKLSNFDVYLSYRGDQILDVVRGKPASPVQPIGLNPPGQSVFTVIEQDGKPVLRITGEIYGCLASRQEFSNYHLRAQVKWGAKKWVPRLNELKDTGLLYHSRGPFGVDYWKSWALSQEFQVIEHGLGEYWSQSTSAFDIRTAAKKPDEEAPRWNPAASFKPYYSPDNHVLAGSDEDEVGEWNTIELLCRGADCLHVVNGKVVMALRNSRYRDGDNWVPLDSGRLQIQSEAAEVYWRDLAVRPLPRWPAQYARYFE